MQGLNPFAKLAVSMFAALVGVSAVFAVVSALEDDGIAGGADEAALDEALGDGPRGEILVSAAASLADAFAAAEAAFEAEHPGADVVLNIAGSATLAEQVRAGTPVDVIAVADERLLLDLEADGLLDSPPLEFASTTLVIAVPAGNAAGVDDVSDLADPDLFLGVCAAEQPCGRYARDALRIAGLDADVLADTVEPDVRALLGKVRSGELDAGLVYASDVASAGGEVTAVTLEGPTASYPAAVVADAPNPVAAEVFVAFLRTPAGAASIASAGFDTPLPGP